MSSLEQRAFSIVGYTFLMAVKEWITYGTPDMNNFEQAIIDELPGFFKELNKALENRDIGITDVFKKELLYELNEGNYLNKSRYFDSDMDKFLKYYVPVSNRVRSWLIDIVKEAEIAYNKIGEENFYERLSSDQSRSKVL